MVPIYLSLPTYPLRVRKRVSQFTITTGTKQVHVKRGRGIRTLDRCVYDFLKDLYYFFLSPFI